MLIGYQTKTGKVITAFAPSVLIPATGNGDFKEFSIRLDAYPGSIDVLHAYLFYEAKMTGTAYFDDVSLVVN